MAKIETKAPAHRRRATFAGLDNTMDNETNTTPALDPTAFGLVDPTAFDLEPANTANPYATNTREELESALTRATERIGTLEDENRTLRFSQIDGDDSRLTDFWEKARRIAQHAGFCTEYDKIAMALGGPARMLDWSGVVNVAVTVTVPVPVGGTGTPEEIENHTMEYNVDDYDVWDAVESAIGGMTRHDIDDHTVDIYSLEVTDTEVAD